ncbi:tetratricopeptide repeat protein [Martelella alba]|uniref:Tetratricopeptide repeat protein n=1 Tax=Martelella alba TaxID=2590451 RepID=A0A506U9X0_9HYPH|nr:tetratricopeptide repeat protein [Martelella alba]TPW29745.1 tetratricopeptide repeat protein [Martelella alba]
MVIALASRECGAQDGVQHRLERLWGETRRAEATGDFEAALTCALEARHLAPENPAVWHSAGYFYLRLGRWQNAAECGFGAIALSPDDFIGYDTLAHAYGELGQREKVACYGRKALELRDMRFSIPVDFDPEKAALPPPPSPETRRHNIIAFSLFGDAPRYCEVALMNAEAVDRVYPGWICRFHVDRSVPKHYVERLKALGAEVVGIDAALARWAGPMWRFAAYDMPDVHRVIFRDADSLITEREARIVGEWVESGKRFHHIRDWYTHTELLHAGLWGVVGGALPAMVGLVSRFRRLNPEPNHFSDQHFLREHVWPYAKKSLYMHDSWFGFGDSQPIDAGKWMGDHIGANISHGGFAIKVQLPDGARAHWALQEKADRSDEWRTVFSYSTIVRKGEVRDHLPSPYLERIERDMRIQPLHYELPR